MIFTKLILAHIIGDFILQSNSWVADKEKKQLKSKYLYLHVLIHAVISFIFLWDINLWWIPVLIGITHFIIDALKLQFQKPKTRKLWFFIDQALHILVILGISVFVKEINFEIFNNSELLKYLTAAVFLTTPASMMIKILLSSWSPITVEHSKVQTESLTNAGKYIGILERLFVFVFIVVNHWEGVGFLIAAKSVFRFSDLAEAKQRKLTEYIMIGTLLSFGIAVLLGILVKL